MTAIEKLIKTAESQIGYLEKATNENLDNPTANAGYNNWTKYARDIDQEHPGFYNGKKNGYSWCDVFVDWCYIKTFGVSMAQKLLNQPNKSMGAGVDYSKAYFKAAGRLFNTPMVGDQVFFGTKHTGIVVQVSGKQFYTIEGNTSSGNTVVANGGGVFRKGPYSVTSDRTFGRPDWSLVDANYSENSSNSKTEETSYSSTEIRYLQQNLTVLGYGCGQPDGVYGAKTKSALKQYEAANNLTSDGLMDDEAINSIKNKIKELQNNLNKLGYNCGTADGVAGNNTIEAIKKFQKANELAQDGIAGKATQSKIQELLTTSASTLKLGDSGLKVKNLQETLNSLGFNCGKVDGDFGNNTYTALKAAQSQFGLEADGVYGSKSKNYLEKNLATLKDKKIGIDVSAYQKNLNLKQAKSEGMSFVMIRAGYHSSNGSLNVDNSFISHYDSAKSLGLPVGTYWYSLAKNEQEAEEEAKYLYENCLKDRSFELPIFLDVEHKDQLSLGKTKVTNICKAFINYLEYMGYVVGIYSSASMFNSYFNLDELKCEFWVAQWSQEYSSKITCGIWQFGGETNKLRNVKVDGMICDQDLLNKDYNYIRENKKNGFGPIKEHGATAETLQLGSTGGAVKALQEALNKLGFLCGTADGDFGKKTLAAVKSFQKAVSLSQDGIVGELTQAAIEKWLPKIYKGQVKVKTGLNIREEDSLNSNIIGECYPNNIVEISVVKDGWLKLANKDGWVAKQYVEKI